MEDAFVKLSDCLCICAEEPRTKTKRDRVMDAVKLLALGTLVVTVAALSAIGLLSLYFAVALSS